MKKTLISLFCFSIICNCALAAKNPCDIKSDSNAVVPVPRLDKDWWMTRHHAILERNKQGNVDLIMVGDSITHYWEKSGKPVWEQYYAKRNAANMGFSGDKTQDAIPNPQWGKNNKAGKLASKIADNKMIYYLDINKKFLNKKGVLTREVMPDLLHPQEKGYKIWAEAMEPTIAKLMRETK